MYHTNLDAPPPASQFRRPWSPDPHDPFGTGNVNLFPRGDYERWVAPQTRREPSEASVEALDLADYAMTLRRPEPQHSNFVGPYPPFGPQAEYPPFPPPLRPLASRESLAPPSLVSAGATSQSHSHSSRSYAPRTPSRRPYSLPPAPFSHSSTPLGLRYTNQPHIADSYSPSNPDRTQPQQEADIANFPEWSRGWYDKDNKPRFSPTGNTNPSHNMFAPAAYPGYSSDPDKDSSPDYHRFSANSYAASDSSHRNLLPWSGDPLEGMSDLDPGIKEERMRMLEQEFGGAGADDRAYDEGLPLVGGVDEKGNIITDGPKKRAVVRGLQGLLALGAAASSIYGALFIKPPSKPPPESSLAAFVLYGLSVLTFLIILYLFLFRPCCCAGRRPSSSGLPQGPNGMMVLPVQGLPGMGGKQKNKGKKGKGGKGGQQGQGVQVNLIVDPGMFDRDRPDDDEEDDGGLDSMMPGAFGNGSGRQPGQGRGRGRPKGKRRSVFAGLAMEEKWTAARKWLKWITFFDVAFMILWGGEFVLIMIGKRCPAGSFDGWCNAYNLASAAACLLCVAFGFGLFFDVKDLHASRQSPRTRT